MARYVTVSAVTPMPALLPEGLSYEEMVAGMMRHWERMLSPVLSDKPDIIVLPEACDRYANCPPDLNRAYYDVRGERMLDFFSRIAKENNCYIAYSGHRQMSDGTFRNSTRLIGRRGLVEGVYNKSHLTVREGVPDGPLPMLCGKDAPVFGLDFGRVGCAICFDLNFDELRRRYMENRPELLLFSSMYHGGFMQQAWAYDCRSYFVGAVANQDAQIISPVGQVIASGTNYYPYVTKTINLDYAVCHLDENWDRFEAARKKYGRGVRLQDPGRVGAVLLTSECPQLSVWDIVREFDIELVDHYFGRCRRDRNERTEA